MPRRRIHRLVRECVRARVDISFFYLTYLLRLSCNASFSFSFFAFRSSIIAFVSMGLLVGAVVDDVPSFEVDGVLRCVCESDLSFSLIASEGWAE